MVEAYVKLIKAGKKTINDVPTKLKRAVQKALDAENAASTDNANNAE